MANTLAYRDIWTQRAMERLGPWHNNPRCRSDEYERYNTLRREKYAREDRLHLLAERVLFTLFACLAISLLLR